MLAVPRSSVSQSGDKPLRVAIVGLTHDHVAGFLEQLPGHHDVELVGIAEADPELVAKYEKRFSLPHELFFSDAEVMIAARHPEALLAYNSIASHRKVIELGAKHGISVMVEKPLTISLDDALAIRKLARQSHIHVLVNYETTWYASNRAAYDAVAAGQLGSIRRVVVHDGHNGPAEIGVSPEFLSWLTDPAQNGAGALYDFGCYGVDLMTWLMHGATPTTVIAVVNHDKPSIYPHVDDDSTIVLQYPTAQAVVQGSWNWPFARKDMEIYGATGLVTTVGSDHIRLRREHDDAELASAAPPLAPNQSTSLSYLAAVLRGQLKDESDLSALDTNVVVMQILDAARTSARTGTAVRLSPLPE
ncbi:MAG: Gfo/Idh/MocA family oxidoreductase [Terracidiphilus sp.]|nr:Gfo/Idh/MocA family oxidoreductase [Terracidiphilus sp.]